jgi:hypothetical protein
MVKKWLEKEDYYISMFKNKEEVLNRGDEKIKK